MLANKRPKSFISGANVDLNSVLISCNKREYHHIFPKDYLEKTYNYTDKTDIFPLANFAFLTKTDNASIQNSAPNIYESRINAGIKNAILGTHFIPNNGLKLDYKDFVLERAKLLADEANRLSN